MFRSPEQLNLKDNEVITITCKSHASLVDSIDKLKQRSARIEGENLIIIGLLSGLIGLLIIIFK